MRLDFWTDICDKKMLKKNDHIILYSYTAVERCYSGASMRARLTLNPQFPPEEVSTTVPHHDQDGGFEDIISYLRDYIAICKEKKKKSFFVPLCYCSLKNLKRYN